MSNVVMITNDGSGGSSLSHLEKQAKPQKISR